MQPTLGRKQNKTQVDGCILYPPPLQTPTTQTMIAVEGATRGVDQKGMLKGESCKGARQQERREQSEAVDNKNHFATAFRHTTSDLSQAAQARASRQYEQQVQDEVEQELADERGRRGVGGVGTAADGSTLFVCRG
jgi:hypothetical protein